MNFHVPDMSCGHCTAAIEKALKAVDAKAIIDTDLESKTVIVDSREDAATLQSALSEAGYPASPV